MKIYDILEIIKQNKDMIIKLTFVIFIIAHLCNLSNNTKCKKLDINKKIKEHILTQNPPLILNETTSIIKITSNSQLINIKGITNFVYKEEGLNRQNCYNCSKNKLNCLMNYTNFDEIVCENQKYYEYISSEINIDELSYETTLKICNYFETGTLFWNIVSNQMLGGFTFVANYDNKLRNFYSIMYDSFKKSLNKIDLESILNESVEKELYCVSELHKMIERYQNPKNSLIHHESSKMLETIFIKAYINKLECGQGKNKANKCLPIKKYSYGSLAMSNLVYYYLKDDTNNKLINIHKMLLSNCNYNEKTQINVLACKNSLIIMGDSINHLYKLQQIYHHTNKYTIDKIKYINTIMHSLVENYTLFLLSSNVTDNKKLTWLDDPFNSHLITFYKSFPVLANIDKNEMLTVYNKIDFFHPLKYPLYNYMSMHFPTKLEKIYIDGIDIDKYMLNEYAKYKLNATYNYYYPIIVKLDLSSYSPNVDKLVNIILYLVKEYIKIFKYQMKKKELTLIVKGVLLDSSKIMMSKLHGKIGYLGIYYEHKKEFRVFNFKITNNYVLIDDLKVMVHELMHLLIDQTLDEKVVHEMTKPLSEGLPQYLVSRLLYTHDEGFSDYFSQVIKFNFSTYDPRVNMVFCPLDHRSMVINNYVLSPIFILYLSDCDQDMFYKLVSKNSVDHILKYELNTNLFVAYTQRYKENLAKKKRDQQIRNNDLSSLDKISYNAFWNIPRYESQKKCEV